MATLQSHGADMTVTGSCHLLKLDDGTNILIDCGMFQGTDERRNEEPFGFKASDIDILLITHAHLDHVGRIPLLVKRGFRGTVVATPATFELANVVLLDSAHLMEEEYRTLRKKALRRGEESRVHPPLYSAEDVESIRLLPTIAAKYGQKIKLSKKLWARFLDAGHILGSAFIELEYRHDGKKRNIVFSGDLGNRDSLVMPKPRKGFPTNHLVMESTYGDRDHRSMKKSIAQFKKIVTETLLNRGNVLIPSFAIERTQDILCILKDMYIKKELPRCKVFLDSPMAIRATHIFSLHASSLSERCKKIDPSGGDRFHFPWLHFTVDTEDSKRINQIEGGAIIIAGSGMCTGGRIMHHFKHNIWNRRNSVIFVGYQAKGTLGRKIVDGSKWIKLYHEKVMVKARVHTINGFSAHAGRGELLSWSKSFDGTESIFLVHGEREKLDSLAEALNKRGAHTTIVEQGKIYRLDDRRKGRKKGKR